MTARRISADTLIALAVETLRREIQPSLGADQRYVVAMITSALDIARREIAEDGEETRWALLDCVYDDGEGSLDQLARDIRSGKISEATHAGLGRLLLAVLKSELAVRNPRFLAQREMQNNG